MVGINMTERKNCHRLVLSSVCCTALFACSPSRAQDQSNNVEAERLEQIVVTGTRNERALVDVPVRTEVVTRKQLEQTHARDVAQALRHRPGLLLRDIHGKGGTEVWMQGLDSDRVLVLVDGRPVSASTGSTIDLTQITTNNVERIEIVKGAVSALYGSAAMGGVINVITRQPDAPLSAELSFDSGTYGSRGVGDSTFGEQNLAANGQVRNGPVSMGLIIGVRSSDGFDLDDSTFAFEGDRGTTVNLTGNIGINFGTRDTLHFTSAWFDEDVDRDFSTFAPGVGNIEKLDAEEATRYTQTLNWTRKLPGGEAFSAWALVENFEDQTIQDTVTTGIIDQQRQAEIVTRRVDLQYDRPVSDNHSMTFGATIGDTALDQTVQRVDNGTVSVLDELAPGSSATNVDAFVQSDIFVGERWELLPGIRVQNDSDFGTHVAPKINVLYQPDTLPTWNPRVRAGIGSGYRVPNLKERHFLFDHTANGYVVLGNPILQPEQSLSLQLGIELSNVAGTRAEASLFQNRFTDLIATSLDTESSGEGNLQVFRYSNVDDARTRGLELNLSHPLRSNLTLSGAITLLDATDMSTGNDLTRRPEQQVQLGAQFDLRRTSITVQSTWQSREFVDSENELESPDYSSLALKVNRTVNSNLRLFAGIDNLTDEHRNPAFPGTDLRPTEGRFAYLGVRYEI